ncbi:hypothetical protein I8752_13725 [Nostocaceae cyanobacterium CENA369]|uniref:Uncharacterized protein n=1 Tax=Dendronalium phyllosphericum CENA369 TaxID=1725256 RepID=A0A8J7I3P3_9NOST|nr:hypothetical protein [Dendronalium phyllosphericum]MBH8574060.1 hypothetical protein [Dendronalium phyllosphericum CENA369]
MLDPQFRCGCAIDSTGESEVKISLRSPLMEHSPNIAVCTTKIYRLFPVKI